MLTFELANITRSDKYVCYVGIFFFSFSLIAICCQAPDAALLD
jgi:hypothetical protein